MRARGSWWIDPPDEAGGAALLETFLAGAVLGIPVLIKVWDELPRRRVVAVLVLALAVAAYCRAVWFAAHDDLLRAQWPLGVLLVTGSAGLAIFGDGWGYLGPLMAIAVCVIVRDERAPRLLGALSVGAGIAMWFHTVAWAPTLTAVIGTTAAGVLSALLLRLWEAVSQLRASREALAITAVEEERLRFARDVHDVVGQALSVMVMTASTIERLGPTDPELVAAQAKALQAVGREAMSELRLSVEGYRGRGVQAELLRARLTLRAAGVTLQEPAEVPDLPAPQAEVLGWLVREATTNILRHSSARHCDIGIEESAEGWVLIVSDDGEISDSIIEGNGITGARERLSHLRGRLLVATDQGFTLRAELPR